MITVVVPYFNEHASFQLLLPRLSQTMDAIGEDYQVLVVDNGSSAEEEVRLRRLLEGRRGYQILRLSRNFGYQGALWAGLDHATGDAVVLMDGDGEDPPELIREFVDAWKRGYAVAYGVRRSRRGRMLMRLAYAIFYRVLARYSDVSIPLDAGEFSLIGGEALAAVRKFQDRTRMLRILRAWVGYRQIGIPYDREARLAGVSKFGFRRALAFAWQGFTASTDLPVRFAITASMGCLGLSAAGIVYYFLWYFFGQVAIPGFASLNITILALFGVLFTCLAIIARYLMALLDETRRRPPYLVDHSPNPVLTDAGQS